MIGNYQPFSFFTSHLSLYFLGNIFYLVCESVLFKIIFEISMWSFFTRKIIRNMLLKATFEIPLFQVKEDCDKGRLWTDYYKYGLSISCMLSRWGLQKRLYDEVIFVAGFLNSFFNLLFSNNVLKSSGNIFSLLQSWLKL